MAESTFTRNLKFEVMDDEGRALLGSYGIAVTLGILWLLLVFFLPPQQPTLKLLSDEETGVVVTFQDEERQTPPAPQEGATAVQPAPGPTNRPPGRQGPERGNPKQGRPGSQTER